MSIPSVRHVFAGGGRRPASVGQILVEFALVVSSFFFLTFAILSVGIVAAAQNSMSEAVRESARYGIVDGHWNNRAELERRATTGLVFVSSPSASVTCAWVGSGTAPGTGIPADCMRPGYVLRISLAGDAPIPIGGMIRLSADAQMAVR
jgi:hypothetical protein